MAEEQMETEVTERKLEENQIFLTMTDTYAHSWRTWDGVREFVQNWYDAILLNLEELSPPTRGRKSLKVVCEDDAMEVEGEREIQVKFVASVQHPNMEEPLRLGSIFYDQKNKTLNLINHNTRLEDKVLLLGYTSKSAHADVIGQFGEGLKVGTLALLRAGHRVMLVTDKKMWKFSVETHPTFNEKVLAVKMETHHDSSDLGSMIPQDVFQIGPGDTCAKIWPIEAEDWVAWIPRFLFLKPPNDSVETEIGTLLLDEALQGQLYVKQVWVSDQTKDSLSSGVNFKELDIDRDRRAVVHQSEIDHHVSCMWAKALRLRPKLARRYYSLLEKNQACDVRLASYYLDEHDVTGLIAEEFMKEHGDNAIPVPNSSTAETLQALSRELQEKVVLCNQILVEILQRSGRVRMMEDVAERPGVHLPQKRRVLLKDFPEEQLKNLTDCEHWVRHLFPDFSVTVLDFYDSRGDEVINFFPADNKYEVPSWMVNADMVHQKVACPADSLSQCQCAAAFLCERIISCQGPRKNDAGDRRVQMLIASLVLKASGGRPKVAIPESDIKQILTKNEEELQKKAEFLQEQLKLEKEKHQTELQNLSAKMSDFQVDLSKSDSRFLEQEQDLIDRHRMEKEELLQDCKAQLKKREDDYRLLNEEYKDVSSQLQREKKIRMDNEKTLMDEKHRHKNEMQILRKECDWYLQKLAARVEQITEISSAGGAGSIQLPEHKELAQALNKLRSQLESDSKSENCTICMNNPKDCITYPCKHIQTCMKCCEILTHCPICRLKITRRERCFS